MAKLISQSSYIVIKKRKRENFWEFHLASLTRKIQKKTNGGPMHKTQKWCYFRQNIEQTHKGNDQMNNAFLQTRRGWPVTCPFSEHCSDEQLVHSSTSILARPPQGHSGRSFRSQTKRHFLRRCWFWTRSQMSAAVLPSLSTISRWAPASSSWWAMASSSWWAMESTCPCLIRITRGYSM